MDDATQKKYIRTLAGDMATLKSGGIPDLEPLPSQPKVSENIEEKPSPIKTYSGDFSDRMKDTNASMATVLASEQDAAPLPRSAEVKSFSRSNFIYISAGVILFIVSGFGAYFAYTRYTATLEPIISAPIISAPIFVDDREEVSGTGPVLLQTIKQSVNRPLASGAVRFIYATNATSTDNSIFSALQIPAPNVLLRNINAPLSMAGVVNVNGNQSPFFILSVESYGETFSGMLSWESVMLRDLAELFPRYTLPVSNEPVVATSTLATTTSPLADSGLRSASTTKTTIAASSAPVIVPGFHDEVVSNHDVRIYRDAENRSIVLYGYWDQITLVIARDPAAFAEILRRIASTRAQ